MGLAYVKSASLTVLCPALFVEVFGEVSLELALQLSALLTMSLSLGVTLILPTVALTIVLVLAMIAAFELALGLGLPSLTVNLALSFSFELAIVEAILAAINLVLPSFGADVVAYAWNGTGAALGPALTGSLAEGWPDGTPASASVTAWLLVATSAGPVPSGQVDSVSLQSAGTQPAMPPWPPPPPSPLPPYPPPQNYEQGIASVTFSAPPGGGTTATGTVTVDSSISTGIGAVTGVTVTGRGSGYAAPATATITDSVAILGATDATPIVLTLPAALTIPVSMGFGCTVSGVTGNTAANGSWCAQVLTPTTVALYVDAAFTEPSTGSGAWTSGTGTLTGGGSGAAVTVTMGGGAQAAMGGFFDGLDYGGGLRGEALTFAKLLGGSFGLLQALLLNLEGRKALLGGASVSVGVTPDDVAASITFLGQILATLRLNLSAAPPKFGLSASASVALQAQIAAIASLVAELGVLLGLAGVDLEIWSYTGPGSGLGAAIAAGPGTSGWHDATPPTSTVYATIVGMTTPAASDAFGVIFSGAA